MRNVNEKQKALDDKALKGFILTMRNVNKVYYKGNDLQDLGFILTMRNVNDRYGSLVKNQMLVLY